MKNEFEFLLSQMVNGAIGPFDPYCMGYMNPGASGDGYISTMKHSTDSTRVRRSKTWSRSKRFSKH